MRKDIYPTSSEHANADLTDLRILPKPLRCAKPPQQAVAPRCRKTPEARAEANAPKLSSPHETLRRGARDWLGRGVRGTPMSQGDARIPSDLRVGSLCRFEQSSMMGSICLLSCCRARPGAAIKEVPLSMITAQPLPVHGTNGFMACARSRSVEANFELPQLKS